MNTEKRELTFEDMAHFNHPSTGLRAFSVTVKDIPVTNYFDLSSVDDTVEVTQRANTNCLVLTLHMRIFCQTCESIN